MVETLPISTNFSPSKYYEKGKLQPYIYQVSTISTTLEGADAYQALTADREMVKFQYNFFYSSFAEEVNSTTISAQPLFHRNTQANLFAYI